MNLISIGIICGVLSFILFWFAAQTSVYTGGGYSALYAAFQFGGWAFLFLAVVALIGGLI